MPGAVMDVLEDGEKPRNIRLIIEYDGSGFLGFQKQSKGRTIQAELEKAVSGLAGKPVKVVGAGRTDAGVHARGQVANFWWDSVIPIQRIALALNKRLPSDIVVAYAEEAPKDFHSRYSALARTYEYTVLASRMPSALENRFVWHVWENLDIQSMSKAAALMVGNHDFSAFGTPEPGHSPLREVFRLDLSNEERYIRIVCTANAFLKHMARGIVGALVDVGLGRHKGTDVERALADGRTEYAFLMAPPNGLCLMAVEY